MITTIKKSFLTLCLSASFFGAFAQKSIREGVAIYKVENSQGINETKVYFKENISRIDVESGPATLKVYTDIENHLGMIVIDVDEAEQYLAAKISKEELQAQRVNSPVYSDFVATTDTQMIGSYNSTRYTFKDNNGGSHELWATKDISLPKNALTRLFNVEGTVVKFKTSDSTTLLTGVNEESTGEMSVTKVPSGYTELTLKELMEMEG